MWLDYVKEREGCEVESNDNGFITYTISDEILFVKDIYVKPEMRSKKIALELVDNTVNKAKEKGCTVVYCTCDLKALNWRDSLKFIASYGCKFKEMKTESLMLFYKEI